VPLVARQPVAPLSQGTTTATTGSHLQFPKRSVIIHSTGLALTQLTERSGQPAQAFAARVSCIGLLGGALTTSVLQRQRRGPPSIEPFGGSARPLVRIEGEGQIALEPRANHYLVPLTLHDRFSFFESLVAAFELSLTYENTSLEGHANAPVVAFRGSGTIVLELTNKLVSITADSQPLTLRHDRVIGWTGSLQARLLSAHETPVGHDSMIRLHGQGTVYFTVTQLSWPRGARCITNQSTGGGKPSFESSCGHHAHSIPLATPPVVVELS